MANWRRDIRYGFRLLARNKSFAAIAICALALGIGPNTAIFSMVWATLLAPLPYPQANRLVVVWTQIRGERSGSSAADYLAYKDQQRSFAHLDFTAWNELHLTSRDGSVEPITGRSITPGFWSKYLGEKIILGRDFLPDEAKPGNDHEVILHYRLWQERFRGDRNIIGKQIFVEGQPYTVVGVLQEGPQDRADGGQFSVPLALTSTNERQYWGNIFGRLKPGVTLSQAQAELSAINRRLAPTRPSSLPANVWAVSVEPLKNNWLSRNLVRNLWLLLGAVGFILLIACVNVANLLLAKGAALQKEIAVRAAIGASRGQVFRQLIVESLSLAVLGGVAGVGLGWALMKLVLRLLPQGALPSEAVVQLNVPVLLFTVAATLIAGILFGCAPAWRAAKLDLSVMLNQGSRSVMGGGHARTQGILVVAEFALALTLLAGAGLALRSFGKLLQIDIGVHTDHVLTAVLQAPKKTRSGPEIDAGNRHLLQKLKATPGVLDAALTTNLPLEGYNVFPFQITGRRVPKSSEPTADFELVTPGYFQILRVRLIKGRFLTDNDRLGTSPVVMVSDSFVHRYLANVDPLSQSLLLPQLVTYGKLGPPTKRQIVGVFHAIHNGNNLTDQPQPAIFASFWQNPWPNTAFVARTAIDPNLMIRTIGKVVASTMPGESLTHPETMKRIVGNHLTIYRFSMALFAAFALLALLLAALGIYGVMAFAVAQRGHEIGLRMALGAQTRDVLKLIVLEGIKLATMGSFIGVAGVYTLGRLMRATLYGVGSFDAISFAAVSVILLGTALIACYIPARRSARVDPMSALRQE